MVIKCQMVNFYRIHCLFASRSRCRVEMVEFIILNRACQCGSHEINAVSESLE